MVEYEDQSWEPVPFEPPPPPVGAATPGDWQVDEDGEGCCVVGPDPHREEIAFVRAKDTDDGTERANARLMAMAPRMLRFVRDVIDDCEDTYWDIEDLSDEWKERYREAKAIAAEAEGLPRLPAKEG